MENYGTKIYNEIEELPAWAVDSIKKAINVGILKGVGTNIDGTIKLGLTQTEVKMIVWLDRCGLFNLPNPQHDDVEI